MAAIRPRMLLYIAFISFQSAVLHASCHMNELKTIASYHRCFQQWLDKRHFCVRQQIVDLSLVV